NSITDENVAIEDLIRDPVQAVYAYETIPHPRIPLPVDLYRSHAISMKYCDRSNSMGVNLANDDKLRSLAEQVNAAVRDDWSAEPLVPGAKPVGERLPVTNPADRREVVGPMMLAVSPVCVKALQHDLV